MKTLFAMLLQIADVTNVDVDVATLTSDGTTLAGVKNGPCNAAFIAKLISFRGLTFDWLLKNFQGYFCTFRRKYAGFFVDSLWH